MMFVNGIASLASLSRDISLFTCEHVPSRTTKQLGRLLKKIVQLRSGFVVHVILIDMEFEIIKIDMGLVDVNTKAAREYVAGTERDIRLIKERCR